MKMVFRCKRCGTEFESDVPTSTAVYGTPFIKTSAKNIGVHSNIISTHECEPGKFGCAEVIGMNELPTTKQKVY